MITELIKLIRVDKRERDVEYGFLLKIAGQLGVSEAELVETFDKYADFVVPKNEPDRILQFYRLILVMNIDKEASNEEMNFIRNLGVKMGLPPEAIEKVFHIMNDYPNNTIPPEILESIFKKYDN